MLVNLTQSPMNASVLGIKNINTPNKINKEENFKGYNLLNSLEYMSNFNKAGLGLTFKGSYAEETARMAEELYGVVDDILYDVKEITSIYLKGTRKFFKKRPMAEGRKYIEINGNTMTEYTKSGKRVSTFKDKMPVKIVEYNKAKGTKNVINFKNGTITLYREGIKENPSGYNHIEAEIFFDKKGEPYAYWKDILTTPRGEQNPIYTYQPK